MNKLPFVGIGVDTLKINVKQLDQQGNILSEQAPSDDFMLFLEYWQEQAKTASKPVETTIPFLERGRLMMYPNGAQGWKFILRNGCMELKIIPRLKLAMVGKVVLQSSYLWTVGAYQAVAEVQDFLYDLFGPRLMLQAAQIDLCVDLVGLSFPLDWRKIFIAKAIKKRSVMESEKDRDVYRGRKLETIMLSGHGSPVNFKCYNKVAEIKQKAKDKEWFYDIWKQNGWDGEMEVWRKEFSIERAGLHEMKLEDIDDTLRNIKRIWAYCTEDWLRMVTPGRTKNRSRWVTHATWTQLQHAFDDYGEKELDALGPLVRKRQREKNVEQGIAAIAGYATTIAAWCEAEIAENASPNDIFKVILGKVIDRWEALNICTEEVIRYKKFLYSEKE